MSQTCRTKGPARSAPARSKAGRKADRWCRAAGNDAADLPTSSSSAGRLLVSFWRSAWVRFGEELCSLLYPSWYIPTA